MNVQASTRPAGDPLAADRPERQRRREDIDVRRNRLLIAVVAVSMLLMLGLWPFLLNHLGLASVWLMLPLVLLTPTHWGLIHESIHGQLLPGRARNESVGRALAISFGLPYEVVRFGHLMHHRFAREPYDRPDVYTGRGRRWLAAVGYWAHLLGGMYVGELIVPVVTLLPARWTASLITRAVGHDGPKGQDIQRLFGKFAEDRGRRRKIRRDWLLSLLLYAAAFAWFGRWWPVLALTMYLRGVWLSTADNLPHYDVKLDEAERSRTFVAPSGWGWLLMNHHLHQLHHRYPNLPWSALPQVAAEEDAIPQIGTHAGYFRSAMGQFRRFGRVE